MLVIVGYVLVVGSVFGGYTLAGGHLGAMYQPLELLMIGGAAVGAFVVGNSMKTIKAVFKSLPTLFQGSKYTKATYMELMALLYEILDKTRKEGLLAIERDIEAPKDSPLFKKYPKVQKDHHMVEFITDYLRLMVSGKLNAIEIEALMDREIDTHHHEAGEPAHALQKIADGLPAFGIVAAVMGVVHTMESVGPPPQELGILIAHALVGTFAAPLTCFSSSAKPGRSVEYSTLRPNSKDYTRDVMRAIGGLLNDVDNAISLAGHTDAVQYAGGERGYSNWELSADRANASRRELVAGGMRENKILRVVGLGSSLPLDAADPLNPMNRRISLVVLNDKTERQIRGLPEEPMEEIQSEADAIETLGLENDAGKGTDQEPQDEPAVSPAGDAPSGDRLAQPAAGGGPV